jgi:hypothetical protein
MENICRDCKYFAEAPEPVNSASRKPGGASATPRGGACWRYPPVVCVTAVPQRSAMGTVEVALATTNGRPAVLAYDFCGEFAASERASVISA